MDATGHILTGFVLLLAAGAAACIDAVPPAAPPSPSRGAFESDVYPILARDCAFPACHGSPDRFFRVYAPGRTRLSADTEIDALATPEEIDLAWERTRSMLASASSPGESWLVRKPLALSAGGAPHMGLDEHGRDVYADREDPRWRTLYAWAQGGWSEP